nr:RNA-directed DNA polymerase, eukaryota, nucleotide-binding alpha-beta plait domain protein [Tanacetum cinerariifolium]
SVTPHDLWRVCGTYGTVVDVFIPVNRSKAGKRFACVRFIKVINLDRLVKNLCTLWIGNYHLYANQVRFERPRINQFPPLNGSSRVLENQGLRQPHGSYAKVVNATSPMVNASPLLSSAPALVLDNACIVERDLSKHIMGREASNDFVSDERIVWVDIEGVPLHAWSRETFSRIGDNDVEGGDDNASTDDGVAETVFDTGVIGEQHSVDPFELYGLLNKRKQEDVVSPVVNAKVMNISQNVEEEVSCASVNMRGSVLGVLEEVIHVG